MARKALHLIRVSGKELAAALRGERRARIRTRLLALRAVLDGRTPAAAAHVAKTTNESVWRWVRRARENGLAPLLRPRAYGRRRNAMTAVQTTRTRAEIKRALESCCHGRLHSRLRAIDAFLAGQPAAEAAAIAQVRPGTLLGWLRFIRSLGGITAALAQWQAPRRHPYPHLCPDHARLRALAVGEKNPSIRKRILALSYVAAGVPVYDAAISARVSESTVYAAMRRFQREGIAAFRNKRSAGCRVRLTSDQLGAVAAFVRANPVVGLDDLGRYVLAEFGVRYTPAGLKNMLTKQLGILQSMPPAHSPQTKA